MATGTNCQNEMLFPHSSYGPYMVLSVQSKLVVIHITEAGGGPVVERQQGRVEPGDVDVLVVTAHCIFILRFKGDILIMLMEACNKNGFQKYLSIMMMMHDCAQMLMAVHGYVYL